MPKGNLIGFIVTIPFFYIFAAPVVYFFSILLGPPFFLLLHLTRGVTRNRLIAGWAVIGVVSFMSLTRFAIPRSVDDLLFYMPFALGGAAVGLLFCWILSTDPNDPWWLCCDRTGEDVQLRTPSICKEDWR
jgi:hypothetical protein